MKPFLDKSAPVRVIEMTSGFVFLVIKKCN